MPARSPGELPPFRAEGLFDVKNVPVENKRSPAVTIRADRELVIALRLAKAGYAGGDLEKILEMKVSSVLAMLQYEKFVDDYQNAYIELNREQR